MTRRPDSAARLVRALHASATVRGCSVTLEPLRETSWESATFSGMRHALAATAPTSPRLDSWLATLPEIDLPMPGQFAAGVEVSERSDEGGATIFTIHALTITT